MNRKVKLVALLALGMLLTFGAYAQVQETKTYKDGSVYTGQINGKGKKEGNGRIEWPNGNSYEGQWKKDKPNGEGTFTYANGIVYQGQWVDNVAKGHGVITMPNGCVIEGEWTEMGNGTGTAVWADGTQYVGTFKDGAPHGEGVMTYPNGDRYEGTITIFMMGAITGHGKFTHADGTVEEGDFRASKLQ